MVGNAIVKSVLVAVGCALIVAALGRLFDSATLTSVAIAAGAGAGVGFFITTRTGKKKTD